MTMLEMLSLNMKLQREKKGFSLEKFAEDLGISKTTLQNIEKGEANPTLETVQQIATQLNVSPLALLSEEYNADELMTAQMLLELLECFRKLTEADRQKVMKSFDHLVKIFSQKE